MAVLSVVAGGLIALPVWIADVYFSPDCRERRRMRREERACADALVAHTAAVGRAGYRERLVASASRAESDARLTAAAARYERAGHDPRDLVVQPPGRRA